MAQEKRYSIGEFSSKTRTPIRTLHYYDEIGLLKPEKDPNSGHRQYTDADVIVLQKIVSFKFLGYRLDQICGILNEPSLDLSLLETLEVQKKAFEQKKEQLETALRAIDRTIKILEEEGEVDSTILMSVISNIQTEKEQRRWLEQRISKDIVDDLFNKTEEEMSTLDKKFVQFTQKFKELSGAPFDDPVVEETIKKYLEMAMNFVGKEAILSFSTIEESEALELEELSLMPFSKEEEEWLWQAMDHYMRKFEAEGAEWSWLKEIKEKKKQEEQKKQIEKQEKTGK